MPAKKKPTMSASFNPDRTGLVRTECRCTFNGTRKLDGIRIFALMKVGVQAHHWSGVLFFYMGLLAASVKGEFPVYGACGPVAVRATLLEATYDPFTPDMWMECCHFQFCANRMAFNVGSCVSLIWIYQASMDISSRLTRETYKSITWKGCT